MGRIAGQAIKGQIEQQRLYAEMVGWIGRGKTAGASPAPLQATIAVPQPDYEHATVLDCRYPAATGAIPRDHAQIPQLMGSGQKIE